MTDIGTTTATLAAQTQCTGDTPSNPCTYWFQYWADGATRTTSTSRTSISGAYTGAAGFDLTNLLPGTLYHNVFCGYGDSNLPANGWWCAGPDLAGQGYYVAKLLCQPQTSAACQALLASPDLSQAGAFRTGAAAGGGVPAITGTPDIGRVLSTADLPASPISRDDGQSVQYADGKALWLFGDTQQYTPSGGSGFMGGTTAAFGAFAQGEAPQTLNEAPTPGTGALRTGLTAPQPFLPSSPGLKVPGTTTPCTGTGNYSPAWTSGELLEDSGKVLITIGEVCVHNGALMDEGFGVMEWNPATNSFTNGSTINTVFKNTGANGLPYQENLSHPVLGPQGSYIYLYSSSFSTDGTVPSGVYIARVPAAQAATATSASYQFWNGTTGTWVAAANFAQATSMISFPSTIIPIGISVGDFSATTNHNYVMLVKVLETGVTTGTKAAMVIYSAPIPTGPWTKGPTVVIPDTCTGNIFGCYAIEGHPELSYVGKFVYSYFSPDDQSGDGTARDGSGNQVYAVGHIRLGTIDW
ncbi:MAG TPA: hypothetical protein VH722_20660 [Alphaproteobacteria bacterium]|nr:hypothetical protein [Alphaproteobacteria bacterium]